MTLQLQLLGGVQPELERPLPLQLQVMTLLEKTLAELHHPLGVEGELELPQGTGVGGRERGRWHLP